MAKKVEEKNKKAVKAPAKKTTAKKETKKVVAKKAEVKKADVKAAKVKPAKVKKVKVKKVKPKKVKKVKVVSAAKLAKRKARKEKINNLFKNTPFVITLCVAIVLLGALIISLISNTIPSTKDGNEIVASIKGKKVTADDLYGELKDAYGYDKLFEIIDSYIAKKEVGNDISEDDEEYVQSVVDYYVQYAEYYGVDLETFLSDYVGLSDITTEDEFFDFVLEDYKKTIAIQKYVGEQATDEEIEEYYEENYGDTYTARHILIEVSDDVDEDEAKETAEKIIKKLKKADDVEETFKELVEEYSDDTGTYDDGGLIEDFTKSDVVDGFYSATAELKDGEFTTEPVKTEYGYHVILRLSSEEAEDLDDIRDEVVRAYAAEQLSNDSNLSTIAWDELRSEYNFKINDSVIKKAYKKALNEAKNSDEEETETEE